MLPPSERAVLHFDAEPPLTPRGRTKAIESCPALGPNPTVSWWTIVMPGNPKTNDTLSGGAGSADGVAGGVGGAAWLGPAP